MCIFGRKKIDWLECKVRAREFEIEEKNETIRSMAGHIDEMRNNIEKLSNALRIKDEQIELLESKIPVYYRDEKGRFISKPK